MARFERPLHELSRIAAASDVPVKIIPPGVRGAPRKEPSPRSPLAATKTKTGRPRKGGERFPSGDLKAGNEMYPAKWRRVLLWEQDFAQTSTRIRRGVS